jgi:hypothetical protein
LMSMFGLGAVVGRVGTVSEELGAVTERRDEAWKKRVLGGCRRHWRHTKGFLYGFILEASGIIC